MVIFNYRLKEENILKKITSFIVLLLFLISTLSVEVKAKENFTDLGSDSMG